MEGKNRPVLHNMLDSVDCFHESRDKDGVLMYIIYSIHYTCGLVQQISAVDLFVRGHACLEHSFGMHMQKFIVLSATVAHDVYVHLHL